MYNKETQMLGNDYKETKNKIEKNNYRHKTSIKG